MNLVKKILKFISIKELNIFSRHLRGICYLLSDFLGYLIFYPRNIFSKKYIFSKEIIKKILIIRLDRIGDVILSTPAIRAVRQTFPQADISLLIKEYTKDLLVTNSNIDRLLIYKKDVITRNFDLAIALHPGFLQNYLTFVSGAVFRAGFTGWGGGFFLTHRIKDDRQSRIRHEVDSALEVVASLGCETKDKSLDISVTQEGEEFAKDFFLKNNLSSSDSIIVIHPGSRQEYIRWPEKGFAALADTLIKEEKAKVILSAGEEERQLIDKILLLMNEKPLIAQGFRLSCLISIIKRCNLFIGNSSGPMHIAAALKVPVVAIFGPVHPLDSFKEWGPWGENNIIVAKDFNCPNCHPSDCKTFRCLNEISVEEVLNAARQQLNNKHEQGNYP